MEAEGGGTLGQRHGGGARAQLHLAGHQGAAIHAQADRGAGRCCAVDRQIPGDGVAQAGIGGDVQALRDHFGLAEGGERDHLEVYAPRGQGGRLGRRALVRLPTVAEQDDAALPGVGQQAPGQAQPRRQVRGATVHHGGREARLDLLGGQDARLAPGGDDLDLGAGRGSA